MVLAAVTGGVLCRHPCPLEAVAVLNAHDAVVADAGLVHCLRTALNLLCHLVLVSQAAVLYHLDACPVLALKVVAASPAACYR